MTNCLRIFSLLSLTLGLTADCRSQDKTVYPTGQEIESLVSDTELTWKQFRPLIAEEHRLLARIGVEPPDRRFGVTYSLDVVVPMVKHKPALFNTPEGFFLIESLFVESREAAVCASTAWKQSKLAIVSAKPELAREFEDLGQRCSDASEALYKVAENAGMLYQKYLKAERDANGG